jgi:hypothetical protein
MIVSKMAVQQISNSDTDLSVIISPSQIAMLDKISPKPLKTASNLSAGNVEPNLSAGNVEPTPYAWLIIVAIIYSGYVSISLTTLVLASMYPTKNRFLVSIISALPITIVIYLITETVRSKTLKSTG